jgi:hypothetical protein
MELNEDKNGAAQDCRRNHEVFSNIPFFNTFLLINLTLIFFFTPFIFPIPVV